MTRHILKKRFLTPAVAALLSITVTVTEVAANTAGLFDFTDLVTDAYRELSGFINDAIADEFDPDIAALLQGTVNNARGVLGLADPNQLVKGIEDDLSTLPQADITQAVPGSTITRTARDLNRKLTTQQAATLLSQDGQQQTQDKLDDVAATVAQTEQHASNALAAISTQAAIKEMAQMHSRSTELLGAVHTELLQGRQDTAVQSLALADISASLDQQLTVSELQRRGDVLTGLELAAFARLF